MASLSFTSITETAASVNLASPARTDWAHWGDGNTSSTTPVNRKSGGGSLITGALYNTTPGVSYFEDSARLMSWTGGAPTASSSNNTFGIYDTTNASGGSPVAGGGFRLTFALGNGSNSIEIWPGTYAGRVTVAASVSDGSSSAISNTTTIDDGGSGGPHNGVSAAVVIECTPGSAGQTLTVDVYLNQAWSTWANTTLCGAAITQPAAGGTSLTPGADTLVLTGTVPTVSRTAHQSLSPAQDTLALTGQVPTVARTANQALSPAQDTLALSGLAPTVTQSAALALAPGAASLTLTGPAPTVARTANQAVDLTHGTFSLQGFAPTVAQESASVALTAGGDQVSVVGHAPSLAQTVTAPVLGSGEARLVFFPSQASIDAKARREINEKWIAQERALTRKLKGRGKRKKQPQSPEPALSFAEVPPPVLEVVEVAAQREQQERRRNAEKRAVELALQAFFY